MPELILAWDGIGFQGRPVKAQWSEIVSMSVCGETGSGKTWTVVNYVTQAVRHGMKPAIGDPHAGNKDSLYTRLAPLAPYMWRPMATSKKASFAMAQAVQAELRRRQEEGQRMLAEGREWSTATHGDSPILLVLDEFNSLMRMFKGKLGDIVKEIAEEGRKFEVYLIASGQHWTVEALGSSELRDTIPSCVVHTCRKTMAAMVTGRKQEEVEWSPRLGPGEVYISLTGGHPTSETPGGPYHVPRMTQADVVDVARRLADSPPLTPEPIGAPRAPSRDAGRPAVTEETRRRILAQRDRIIDLFLDEANSVGAVANIIQERPPDELGRARNGGCRVVEEILRAEIRRHRPPVEKVVSIVDPLRLLEGSVTAGDA